MSDDIDKLSKEEDKAEKAEKSLKFLRFWVGSIVLFVGLAVFFPVPAPTDQNNPSDLPWWLDWVSTNSISERVRSLLYEFRLALGGALVTFFAFTFVFDRFMKSDARDELQLILTRLFTGNRQILKFLNARTREIFVQNALMASLGDLVGQAVFKNAVDPLIGENIRFQRHYKYDVTMLEDNEFPTDSTCEVLKIFPETKYRWIIENIEYQSFDPKTDEVFDGPFNVAIVFDKNLLPTVFGDEDIYFRCLVELDDEAKTELISGEGILKFSNDEIEYFVRSTLGFKAFERQASNELAFTVSLKSGLKDVLGNNQPAIIVKIEKLNSIQNENRPQIYFRYPHFRSATHFTMTLPQPCENPRFCFTGSNDVHDVNPIYYITSRESGGLSRDPTPFGQKPERVSVSATGWVFPTSGITFTWKNND